MNILPQDTIVASGPIIIENNKVLLNKEKKGDYITPWLFPGGKMENLDDDLEDICRREAKEEMGIGLEIIRPLSTLILKRPEKESYAVLVHFLAKRIGEIKPAEDIAKWDWFDIHNLPEDCAPNVKEVIFRYLEEPK